MVDNGLTRVSGLDLSNGVQSDPSIGSIDLRNEASLDGMTGPFFDAPQNSVLEAWIDHDPAQAQLFLRYMVECALPEGVSVRLKYQSTANLLGIGAGNLGASLQAGQLSVDQQEKVSSCLLARTNATGNHMQIELVGHMVGCSQPMLIRGNSPCGKRPTTGTSSPARWKPTCGSRIACKRDRVRALVTVG